jgi:DUF1680 family protein
MEEVDNPEFDKAFLSPTTTYTLEFESNLLGGVQTVTACNGADSIKFRPYYAWDNRAPGKMQVWVKYDENMNKE